MTPSQTRTDLFDALRGLAEIMPGMRVGQLMAAVGEVCADMHGRGLWEASDDELAEAVWRSQQDFQRSRDPNVQPV